jgi:hypothetical protein
MRCFLGGKNRTFKPYLDFGFVAHPIYKVSYIMCQCLLVGRYHFFRFTVESKEKETTSKKKLTYDK